MKNQDPVQINPEQLIYANVLEKGMYLGLALMLVTFAIYVFGILPPAVPVDQVSHYWSQDVHKYLEEVNANFLHRPHPVTGWGWMALIGMGDFLNFIPVAILAGVTILCYLAIVPTLLARKDMAYAVMALLEAVILAGAASGLLSAGGH